MMILVSSLRKNIVAVVDYRAHFVESADGGASVSPRGASGTCGCATGIVRDYGTPVFSRVTGVTGAKDGVRRMRSAGIR